MVMLLLVLQMKKNSFISPLLAVLLKKCNIRNFQVLSTDFRRKANYGIETITYRAHLFGKNCHLNINLQFPLKNLKWILRNGNVTHIPGDYAENFSQIFGLLIRNMVSKNVNLHCFTTIFFKKNIKKCHHLPKNYKIVIENVF